MSEAIDELVRRAQAGDRAAFRQLVLATERDVRFYVGAFEASAGMVEEVVQATFVAAYQNLARYRGEGAFAGWLKAIARNHLLRLLRDQKRFAEATDDVLEAALATAATVEVEAEAAERVEARTRTLRRCLERLPDKLRALIDARYTRGVSTVALARDLERTEVWVRVSLCRARQALRRCMEAETTS